MLSDFAARSERSASSSAAAFAASPRLTASISWSFIVAEPSGRDSEVAREERREGTDAFESTVERHVRHAAAAAPQQRRSSLQPQTPDVAMRRLAEVRREEPMEMKRGETGVAGHGGQRQRFGQPAVDDGHGAIEAPPQFLAGGPAKDRK